MQQFFAEIAGKRLLYQARQKSETLYQSLFTQP